MRSFRKHKINSEDFMMSMTSFISYYKKRSQHGNLLLYIFLSGDAAMKMPHECLLDERHNAVVSTALTEAIYSAQQYKTATVCLYV